MLCMASTNPTCSLPCILLYCLTYFPPVVREEGGKRERHRMPAPVVDARVLRGLDRLGRLTGAPGDVVARCCLVALAEGKDSRDASSFEVENGTTMRRRRVGKHPNNRDSDGRKAIRVVDAVPSVDHRWGATSTKHVAR